MWILSAAWECPVGYCGGLGAVVSRLLPALARRGAVVHVCTEGSRRFSYRYCGALVFPCSETVVSPGGFVGFSEGLVVSYSCFRLGMGADVVLAHDHHTAPCVVALAEHGVKTVYFIHTPFAFEVEVQAANVASKFVANSQKTAKALGSAVKRAPDVVYLPPPYSVVERKRPFRKRPRVLIFLRYQPYKDPTWFLDHLDALWRRTGGGFTVVVAGKGTEALRSVVAYPWVDVMGSVDERAKLELYANSDLLLYPARFEPYGLVPLESIALGTPALVSTGAGVSEVLPAGVFDHEKPEEAVEVLAQYVGEPGELEELLHRQRESPVFKKRWIDVADELLSGLAQ